MIDFIVFLFISSFADIYVVNQSLSFTDSCLTVFMECESWDVFSHHKNVVTSRMFFIPSLS